MSEITAESLATVETPFTPEGEKRFLALTAADIVCAYVSNHQVPVSELPTLIATVFNAVSGGTGAATVAALAEKPVPAVPVEKSVQEDRIICLEDGEAFKSLKRHLREQYNMTPEQYRAKWDLPADYPMVAPEYSKRRAAMAKANGLGQKRKVEANAEVAVMAAA